MENSGINHLTFSVSDLARSVDFYSRVLGARLRMQGPRAAYFSLGGLWLALNLEADIPRNEIWQSYTHIAFNVDRAQFAHTLAALGEAGIPVSPSRVRQPGEGQSVYFTDPDGHKFEFHTGTLEERIAFYKTTRPDWQFFD